MEYIEFEKEFNKLISKYNIKSNNITKQLYTYMECILESNNNINLTSITNPNEFIVKHFIDSLTIIGSICYAEAINLVSKRPPHRDLFATTSRLHRRVTGGS